MRQDVSRLIFFKHYMKSMFPYNDTENAWISGNNAPITKAKYNNQSFIISLSIALATALLSTLLPALIYFSKLSLF